MTLIMDAGALIAFERGDRRARSIVKGEELADRVPVTHGGVVGQVWRTGRDRQASLARLIRNVDVVPLDCVLGKLAGELLAQTGGSDVVDAALMLLANDGDNVVTSDPEDLRRLALARGLEVELITL